MSRVAGWARSRVTPVYPSTLGTRAVGLAARGEGAPRQRRRARDRHCSIGRPGDPDDSRCRGLSQAPRVASRGQWRLSIAAPASPPGFSTLSQMCHGTSRGKQNECQWAGVSQSSAGHPVFGDICREKPCSGTRRNRRGASALGAFLPSTARDERGNGRKTDLVAGRVRTEPPVGNQTPESMIRMGRNG